MSLTELWQHASACRLGAVCSKVGGFVGRQCDVCSRVRIQLLLVLCGRVLIVVTVRELYGQIGSIGPDEVSWSI